MMTPGFRKLNLTAHVTSSVGWLGAVACFLVLSVVGLISHDAETVRGTYLAMNLIGQYIMVPLSVAALLTGVVQSLGTEWGLFRYYWVLAKFALTIGATILLLVHQFKAVAEAARRVSGTETGAFPGVGSLGTQLVVDASLALLLLLVITTLGVYKPWGKTYYWRRKMQRDRREGPGGTPSPIAMLADSDNETDRDSLPLGLKIFLAVISVLVVLAVLHHGGYGH
jgi:hypothetical protein